MLKTCLKCGHVAEVVESAMAECPQCGAIYAKVEELRRQQAAPVVASAPPDAAAGNRKRQVLKGLVLALALAVLGMAGWAVAQKHQERQRIAAEKAEHEAERAAIRKDFEVLLPLRDRFKTTNELAGSTARIALAGPVGRLQDIHVEAKRFEPQTQCGRDVHLNLLSGMERTIKGYLGFMQQDESQAMIMLGQARSAMSAVDRGIIRCVPGSEPSDL